VQAFGLAALPISVFRVKGLGISNVGRAGEDVDFQLRKVTALIQAVESKYSLSDSGEMPKKEREELEKLKRDERCVFCRFWRMNGG